MEKKILSICLILLGIIIFYLGCFFDFYYSPFSSMILAVLIIFLRTFGIIFLIFGVFFYLKKQIIGIVSLVTSIAILCYLIIWFLSIINDWSFDTQWMLGNNVLTLLYLAFFSIITGLIANIKVEKLNKFGLAGLGIAIWCLFFTFINIIYFNSTIIPIE